MQTAGRSQVMEGGSSLAGSGAMGWFHRGIDVRILQLLCVGLGELDSDKTGHRDQ